MADNYLEKRYREVQEGAKRIVRQTPTLDTLLKRLQDKEEKDEGYEVKQAQIDALLRSACLPGVEFSANPGPLAAEIHLSSPSVYDLGKVVMALSLKAAQLHLKVREEELSMDGRSASIKLTVYR